MATLGEKIRYFRKRNGMSQLALEVAAGMAVGSLSRIENGEINPTKETVVKISEILELDTREVNYILGLVDNEVTQQELDRVKAEVGPYFSKPGVFAYLIDERWRLRYASKSFVRISELPIVEAEKAYGETIITIVLNEKLGVRKLLDPERLSEILKFQLSRYFAEVGFIQDEHYFKTVEEINKDKLAKSIWDQIIRKEIDISHYNNSRIVDFNIKGMRVPLTYSREPHKSHSRFEIIEYTLTNVFAKLVRRILA